MVTVLTITGAALIIAALQDLFHTLFDASARGDRALDIAATIDEKVAEAVEALKSQKLR